MTVTSVQSNSVISASSVNSQAITLSSGVTQGNLLVCCVGSGNNANAITAPDASWQQAGSTLGVGSGSVACETSVWYLLVDAAHAGQTSWTWTYASKHTATIAIREWNSTTGWPSSPLDKTASNSGTGTAVDSGTTGTTSQAAELWVASANWKGGSAAISGLAAGWTAGQNTGSVSSNQLQECYQVASAAGTADCSFTITTSQNWVGEVATFTPSSGSPPPASAQVNAAPQQPAPKSRQIPPQVITGVLANAFSADAGAGAAAVTDIAVSSSDSGTGAAAAGSLNTGAVVAAIRAAPQPVLPRPAGQQPQVITGPVPSGPAGSFTWEDGAITQATSGVATISVTLSAAIAAGDLIVCSTAGPSFAIGDVSDTAGNTWQQIGSTTGFVSMFACLSAVAAAGGTVITVAHSGASGTRFLVADRFRPSGAASNVSSSAGSTAGGTSGDCGSITGDPGGNLLVAGIHTDQGNLTWTAGSSNGVSATSKESVGNGSGSGYSEYVLSTAAGTQSMSWSASAATNGQGALQATFSAAAASTPVSAQVNAAPKQPVSQQRQIPPQVITGSVPGTVSVSSSDSGHGSGAVPDIQVIPVTEAAGSGAGAAGSLNTGAVVAAIRAAPQHPVPAFRAPAQVLTSTLATASSADSASAALGVPVIRPQAAGTADSGHGSAQGQIHVSAAATGHGAGGVAAVRPEAAAAGHGAGAVTSVRPEAAAGTGSGHGNPAIGVSSTDSGHGAGAAGSLNTGAVVAAIQAVPRPFRPAVIPPQVITGPSGTRLVTSADYGHGQGSDFFFITSADTGNGAGHGIIQVSAAASAHGAGTALSRWPASADTGHGAGAALSRWPSSAGTGHGAGRALSAWPSSADAGAGHGAVTRVAVDSAASGHGTDSYGGLGIWTLLPPSWSERRGLVWITARLEGGELLELVSGLPPSRELLELARQVSSGPVRHIRAADGGRARAQVPRGIAAVTVWVTEAVQVAVWVEAV